MFKTYLFIISKINCSNLRGLGFLFQDESFGLSVSEQRSSAAFVRAAQSSSESTAEDLCFRVFL